MVEGNGEGTPYVLLNGPKINMYIEAKASHGHSKKKDSAPICSSTGKTNHPKTKYEITKKENLRNQYEIWRRNWT